MNSFEFCSTKCECTCAEAARHVRTSTSLSGPRAVQYRTTSPYARCQKQLFN